MYQREKETQQEKLNTGDAVTPAVTADRKEEIKVSLPNNASKQAAINNVVSIGGFVRAGRAGAEQIC